jgi:SAM-dependent methyltransferase
VSTPVTGLDARGSGDSSPGGDRTAGTACAACGAHPHWLPCHGSLHRCPQCGFVAFHVTDPAALDTLYDSEYFAGAEYTDYLGEADALRRSMRRHLRQMARYQPPGGRLLEIGCAYGLFLDEARAQFDVAGMDVCPGPVTHARQVLQVHAHCGDFVTHDWGDRRFDVVCMWDTIEHLSAPDLFMRRAAELLTDDGMLFLTTGDIGALNARLRGRHWRQIHPPTHVSYFSRRTMATMLERTGFRVEGIETAAYYHSMFNILTSLERSGGLGARPARLLQALLGERLTRRLGGWLNLGDTMFVAARKTHLSDGAPRA